MDFETMPLGELEELRIQINSAYERRKAAQKSQLIKKLCDAYNELRVAFPDIGYFPVSKNELSRGAISTPRNAFDEIGLIMSENWFDTVVKMEVYG